jgi:hypothetical protein
MMLTLYLAVFWRFGISQTGSRASPSFEAFGGNMGNQIDQSPAAIIGVPPADAIPLMDVPLMTKALCL